MLRLTWVLLCRVPLCLVPHLQVFGRRAGFIAVQASLASGIVDICLIPGKASCSFCSLAPAVQHSASQCSHGGDNIHRFESSPLLCCAVLCCVLCHAVPLCAACRAVSCHAVLCGAEESFELEGPSGVLAYLQKLLDERGHAVICVSEGAGQNLMYPGACTHPW
jgi:6-phosphofructokinase